MSCHAGVRAVRSPLHAPDTSSIAPFRVFIDTESSDESETSGVYRGQVKWPEQVLLPRTQPILLRLSPRTPTLRLFFNYLLILSGTFDLLFYISPTSRAPSYTPTVFLFPVVQFKIHLADYLLIDN
jgi:hypothetical protein